MSLCVSSIIASAGDLLDDVTIPDPTTTALRFLNEARRHLATETNCIIDTRSNSSEAYIQRYSVSNDVIGIKGIRYDYSLTNFIKLVPLNKDEYESEEEAFTSTTSQYSDYFFDIIDRSLNLKPPIASSAGTTTLVGAITASSTSVTVADSSTFRIKGRGLIDSEVLGWQFNSANNCYGLQRGLEGTSAATHTSGSTITERDIIYDFFKLPADLAYGDNVEAVFEMFPKALEYYICWQAKIKDTDDTNPGGGLMLDNSFKTKFEEEKNKIMYYLNKTFDGVRTIKEV